MLPIVRDRRRGVDQPGGLGRAVAQTLSGWWACCWVAIRGISESRTNPSGCTDSVSATRAFQYTSRHFLLGHNLIKIN